MALVLPFEPQTESVQLVDLLEGGMTTATTIVDIRRLGKIAVMKTEEEE
jgi:hypothetical protein